MNFFSFSEPYSFQKTPLVFFSFFRFKEGEQKVPTDHNYPSFPKNNFRYFKY
jgi:hypothetical protein